MNQSVPKPTEGKLLTREQVTSAITTLMSKISTQSTTVHEKVVQELFDLAAQIDALYAELSNIQPSNLKNGEIKTAHDELSAVVQATSEATFLIIGEAEKLEKLSKDLPEAGRQAVVDSVTRIYEACGFQDITGQRITKVVRTLKTIEERVDALIQTLGGQRPSAAADERKGDEALLNGPSMPGQGISQDEIDKLLGF